MLRDVMWSGRGVLVGLLLPAALLAGCARAGDGEAKPPATARAAGEPGTAAKSGGRVGAAGSACALPVTFDVAEGWKPEAVDVPPPSASKGSGGDGLADDLADAILHQGPVSAACEVDAKPAGHIGFLRVWTGTPGDADAGSVLRAFVAAEGDVGKEKYGTFEAGGLTGAEVRYTITSEALGETEQECALAVITPKGPVVLHLGGADDEEHRQMLPAYELARRTLRLS